MSWMRRIEGLAVLTAAAALVFVPSVAIAGEPPPAPTNLLATAMSYQRIDLAWSGDWLGDGHYELEQSTDGVTWISLGSIGTVRGVELWGLPGETTYFFRVRAVSEAGLSPYSNVASARTLTIPPGSLHAVAVSRSRIDLTWDDNSGEEVRYEIERSLDREAFKRIASLPADATAFTDTPLRKATTYHYQVRACTADACTPFHYPVSATTAAS